MRRLIPIVAASMAFTVFPLAAAAAPDTEGVYADGQTYTMIGATLVTNASPGLLKAPPIYILGYPTAPGTTGPITLPSGYQPQCNPCTQEPIAYHDHLVTGAPGLGTSGTSGSDYKAPWRIVAMMYSPTYAYSPFFSRSPATTSSPPPKQQANSSRSTPAPQTPTKSGHQTSSSARSSSRTRPSPATKNRELDGPTRTAS